MAPLTAPTASYVCIRKVVNTGSCHYDVVLEDRTKKTISEEEAQEYLHPWLVKFLDACPTLLWNRPLGNALPADDIPHHIQSKVSLAYRQDNNPLCLSYSLANALLYCGFPGAASSIASQGPSLASLPRDLALPVIRDIMKIECPAIARPMIFNQRTSKGKNRRLSVETLLSQCTPYPTLVVPIDPNGNQSHAICVVDDLIFDGITSHALFLLSLALSWIFNQPITELAAVYRFMTKESSAGKVKDTYIQPMTFHKAPIQLCCVEPACFSPNTQHHDAANLCRSSNK